MNAHLLMTPRSPLPPGVDYRLVGQRTLTLNEFLDIPDNTRQRDVERRISDGRANHLFKFDEAHRKVSVCVLSDGTVKKADGHTRAWFWRKGLSDAKPLTVVADVWQCADDKAAMSVYDKIDAMVAGETGPDRVTGAAKEAKLKFNSPLLRDGKYSTAIRELFHYVGKTKPTRDNKADSTNQGVKDFSKELVALDNLCPSAKRFPSCVIFACILTMRILGRDADLFWTAYAGDKGVKYSGKHDAVVAFEKRLAAILKKGSYARYIEVTRDAIGAIKAYRADAMYTEKRGYNAADPMELRSLVARNFGVK